MALPTLERTYEFVVNQIEGGHASAAEDHRYALLKIHNTLRGFGSNPWTVHSSSDATTAGAGNNVTVIGDITYSTGSHTWIVWNVPSGGQLCFDYLSSQYYLARMYYSPESLFPVVTTPGARPTAVDEIDCIGYEHWLGYQTSVKPYKLHFIHDVAGGATIFMACVEGVPVQTWISMLCVDEVSGWDYPYFFFTNVGETATVMPSYAQLHDIHRCRAKVASGGLLFSGALTTEMTGDNPIGQNVSIPNDFSGRVPMSPIGFASTAIGARGRHARVPDLWFTNSGGVASGDTLEENAGAPTFDFAVFGDLVVPWNGTVPQIT
jgi:hypothetical protein